MRRRFRAGLTLALGVSLVLTPLTARTAYSAPPVPAPGASGVGDSYFPLDGNGGYDVGHYDLAVQYNPSTDKLTGVTTISAKATQTLSAFDLDLYDLTVRAIVVNGKKATWTRTGQELKVTPSAALAKGASFTTIVVYDGVPKIIDDASLGLNGFFTTSDGAFVAGQPHGAASWFPVNDHPSDKATYTFHVAVPNGLSVTSNGTLANKTKVGSQTVWTWVEKAPMASYLATIAIGKYKTTSYTSGGKSYYDAVDSDLFTPFATPKSGTQFAYSQTGSSTYKRLSHSFDVPAAGGDLSFAINRSTEESYDYVFVEAHTAGADDWTTLPDANGHTSQDVGNACAYGWAQIHPFLEHYQTPGADDSCEPTGTTGAWNGATGASDGYETWKVDLSAYAGTTAEVSITYVSDDVVQGDGVAIDDVVGPGGQGSTSFEADSNPLDGWNVPGAPAGSPVNTNDWVAGTTALITTTGEIAEASLKREPEIVKFLSSNFGPYPFNAVGGIVTDAYDMGFALETQTRPIYSPVFFGDSVSGDSVIVHELTHQWFGDDLAVDRWKDIWLNEGFATYAEWLWSEHEGLGTAQEQFDARAAIPADDDFWNFTIGDPGPVDLFAGQVYDRGGMTLHALRLKVGDPVFFKILKTWAAKKSGGNVSTPEFIALAEKISGQKLGPFFTTWLYTPSKPEGIEPAAAALSRVAAPSSPKTALDRRFGDRRG